jgi:hypothetical protein
VPILKDATEFVLAVNETFDAKTWAELDEYGMIA